MYKIGDFSIKVNVPVKTLRYYDEIDLFKPSYQDYFTGYRYYENYQIYEIDKIKKLKDLNLSLKEIKDFLETEDINILLNKEKEFIMKIEAIKNYVIDESYEIVESNYDEYIKWNGLKVVGNPISLEIRDNNCKYFVVYKNKEFFSEVFLFTKEENLINLNITKGIKNYFDKLINYLKKDYDYLTFKEDEEFYHNLKLVREKCNCIEEKQEEFKGYDGKLFKLTSVKVSLK